MLPYLVIGLLLIVLAYRYLWLWRMTEYWEQTVAIYIVQSGSSIDRVAELVPTLPAWQMVLSIWSWHYPSFIINQLGYDELVRFFSTPRVPVAPDAAPSTPDDIEIDS